MSVARNNHKSIKFAFSALMVLCLMPKTSAAAESLDDVGLIGVQWMPNWRIQVAGESVLLPAPTGHRWLEIQENASCPFPKFVAPKVFAAGWAVRRGGEEDPFNPCWGSIRSASFFILPKSNKNKPVLRVVTESTFRRWVEKAQNSEMSGELARLILAASVKLAGADDRTSSVVKYAGGENEGFPFVAGILRLTSPNEKSSNFYFAAAISMVGKTWTVPVVLSEVVPSQSTDVAEKATRLAQAVYHLNKDFRGSALRADDQDGPIAWDGGKRD
jgi:hypothetical protein